METFQKNYDVYFKDILQKHLTDNNKITHNLWSRVVPDSLAVPRASEILLLHSAVMLESDS